MAYVKPDPAIFMQKYEESMTRRGSSQYEGWSPKKGILNRPPQRNVIRIMPPHPNMIVTMPDGSQGPDAIIGSLVHFNLGPQQNLGSPCLEWFGKMCPGCAWNKDCQRRAEEATRAGNAVMAAQYKELAYRQRAGNRFRCQVVDMAKPEMGVQRYSFGVEVEKGLRICFTDDNVPPGYLDITDPEHGRNVIMDVSMKIGKDKKEMPDYSDIKTAKEATALMDMEWLDQIQDLTEDFWWEPTTDQVAGALQGVKMDRPNTTISLPGATAAPTPALPSPAVVSSGPVPAAARAVGPPAPAPAPAPAVAPTPASTPASAAIGRRGSRGAPPASAPGAPAPAAAPTPAPPAAVPAQVPPAAVAQPMPGRRRPAQVPAVEAAAGPYGAARQLVAQFIAQGYEGREVPAFDILEITPEQAAQAFATKMAPPCYEPPDTDPSDGGCRDCRMLLACLTKKYGLAA